jgi:Mn2+/Fe2+ NRAMP family transporter
VGSRRSGTGGEKVTALEKPQNGSSDSQGAASSVSSFFKRLAGRLGPGLITGASDDDPSGIATYSQAGAQLGFSISWTMLLTYPLMTAIQQISAQVGRTTGRGIAGNIRLHYPNWLLQSIVALIFVANTINIGADLGAMADSVQLLIGGPALVYVVMLGASCALLQVFIDYNRYVSVLKWLTLALFAYVGTLVVWALPSVLTCFSGKRLRKSRTFAPLPSESHW